MKFFPTFDFATAFALFAIPTLRLSTPHTREITSTIGLIVFVYVERARASFLCSETFSSLRSRVRVRSSVIGV